MERRYPTKFRVAELPAVREELYAYDDPATRLAEAGKLMARYGQDGPETVKAKNRMYAALQWLHNHDDLTYTQLRLLTKFPQTSKATWSTWWASHTGPLPDYPNPQAAMRAARRAADQFQTYRDTGHTARNVARDTVAAIARKRRGAPGWMSQPTMAKLLGISQPRVAQLIDEHYRLGAGLGARAEAATVTDPAGLADEGAA